MISRLLIIASLIILPAVSSAAVISSNTDIVGLHGYTGTDGAFTWDITNVLGNARSLGLMLTATTSCPYQNDDWTAVIAIGAGPHSYSEPVEKVISPEMQRIMFHFPSTTSKYMTPDKTYTLSIDLTSCNDIMGVASTTAGFIPWYILYSDENLEFSEPATGIYWKNIVGFDLPTFPYSFTGCTNDLSACLKSLIVPSSSSTVDMVNAVYDKTVRISPWGYVTRAFEILWSYDATTTLPSLVITIPSDLPGGGGTLDLTPWDTMAGEGSMLASAIAKGDDEPFMEKYLPYWVWGWKIVFIFAILRLVTKSQIFASLLSTEMQSSSTGLRNYIDFGKSRKP